MLSVVVPDLIPNVIPGVRSGGAQPDWPALFLVVEIKAVVDDSHLPGVCAHLTQLPLHIPDADDGPGVGGWAPHPVPVVSGEHGWHTTLGSEELEGARFAV